MAEEVVYGCKYTCTTCFRNMERKTKMDKFGFNGMCYRCMHGKCPPKFDDWRNEREIREPGPGFRHDVPPIGWMMPKVAYVTWARFYQPGTFFSHPENYDYIIA